MIAVPVIDTIDEHTFEYKKSGQSQLYKGGFDWGLNFQWIERTELGDSDEPFLTPAMCRVTNMNTIRPQLPAIFHFNFRLRNK